MKILPINNRLTAISLGLSLALAGATAYGQIRHSDTHEDHLIKALQHIKQLDIDTAISQLEILLEENPRFKLAHLVYADMLKAKSQGIQEMGALSTTQEDKLKPLRDEAKARWQHHTAHPNPELIPGYIVKLNSEHKNLIVVDTSQSRLLLYKNENGQPKLVDDFYASIGKNGVDKLIEGDKRTPLGVYFVSRYLEPETLPDFYGHGAFPINYPNSWDKLRGRSGSGIWLHGNPLDTYSRPPLDSDGCVTVTNMDFDRIKPHISVDQTTPFLISDGIEWVSPDAIEKRKSAFINKLKKWAADWESLDNDRYLAHYSKDFNAEGKDFAQWQKEKSEVNSSKKFVRVGLDEISIFQYPGKDKVAIITFEQTYESDTYKGKQRKRLYLKQEDDAQWRIFYEGSV